MLYRSAVTRCLNVSSRDEWIHEMFLRNQRVFEETGEDSFLIREANFLRQRFSMSDQVLRILWKGLGWKITAELV